MKLFNIILMFSFFSSSLAMQLQNQYFETKFKMAQLLSPRDAKGLKMFENGAILWGGFTIIAGVSTIACQLGYNPNSSIPIKAYLLAFGGCGLLCIKQKRTANKYRKRLIEIASKISDNDALTAQDIGVEAYCILFRH